MARLEIDGRPVEVPDGTTVLFSWRQKQDEGYHLWTVRVDGSGLKQLTSGPWHDYNACWLPDGGIGFLSEDGERARLYWVKVASRDAWLPPAATQDLEIRIGS